MAKEVVNKAESILTSSSSSSIHYSTFSHNWNFFGIQIRWLIVFNLLLAVGMHILFCNVQYYRNSNLSALYNYIGTNYSAKSFHN